MLMIVELMYCTVLEAEVLSLELMIVESYNDYYFALTILIEHLLKFLDFIVIENNL